ncbi:hypothetical protein ACWEQ8_20880 [Streptomyces noursei]
MAHADVSPSRFRCAWRWPVAATLIAGTIAILKYAMEFRKTEAEIGARIVGWIMQIPTRHLDGTSTVLIKPTHEGWLGLRITVECSVAYVIAVLFVIAAIISIAIPRLGNGLRILTGAVAAALTLFILNQLRIVVIAGSIEWLGRTSGYELSHRYLGTLITLVSLTLSIFVFFLVVGHSKAAGSRRAAAHR